MIFRTFNEAPDVPGPVQQHTITPGDLPAISIAFVWQRFEIDEPAGLLLACVMVNVPANELIAGLPTDRMPAVLAEEEWATWLGEEPVPLSQVRRCLKTIEGVRWTMVREEQKANTKAKRQKPTVSDPGGLS